MSTPQERLNRIITERIDAFNKRIMDELLGRTPPPPATSWPDFKHLPADPTRD